MRLKNKNTLIFGWAVGIGRTATMKIKLVLSQVPSCEWMTD
jgi:hypothetical protein